MPDTPYVPPKVWTHDAPSGGKFASINAPTAGAREEKVLPVGNLLLRRSAHQQTPQFRCLNRLYRPIQEKSHVLR